MIYSTHISSVDPEEQIEKRVQQLNSRKSKPKKPTQKVTLREARINNSTAEL